MFTFPWDKWVGGIFYEHGHRLIASGVGFLTIILAVWIWRGDDRRWLRHLGIKLVQGYAFAARQHGAHLAVSTPVERIGTSNVPTDLHVSSVALGDEDVFGELHALLRGVEFGNCNCDWCFPCQSASVSSRTLTVIAAYTAAKYWLLGFSRVLAEEAFAKALELNPDLPVEALGDAYRKLTRVDAPTLVERNRAVHRATVGNAVHHVGEPDRRGYPTDDFELGLESLGDLLEAGHVVPVVLKERSLHIHAARQAHDAPVLLPEFKAVANFNRVDNEVCSLQGLGPIRGRGDLER